MTKGRGRELKDLARLFLKLGLIGFGGPAVHISLMEQEVVVKRKWMSAEHFLDLIGATNLMPGSGLPAACSGVKAKGTRRFSLVPERFFNN